MSEHGLSKKVQEIWMLLRNSAYFKIYLFILY